MTRPKLSSLFCALAAVAIAVVPLRASDPVGAYAIIQKVMLAPNDTEATSVQIHGVFSFAVRARLDRSASPGRRAVSARPTPVTCMPPCRRASCYYTCASGKEAQCRNEWADLKTIAGTNQVIGFGSRWAMTGTVKPVTRKDRDAGRLSAQRRPGEDGDPWRNDDAESIAVSGLDRRARSRGAHEVGTMAVGATARSVRRRASACRARGRTAANPARRDLRLADGRPRRGAVDRSVDSAHRAWSVVEREHDRAQLHPSAVLPARGRQSRVLGLPESGARHSAESVAAAPSAASRGSAGRPAARAHRLARHRHRDGAGAGVWVVLASIVPRGVSAGVSAGLAAWPGAVPACRATTSTRAARRVTTGASTTCCFSMTAITWNIISARRLIGVNCRRWPIARTRQPLAGRAAMD